METTETMESEPDSWTSVDVMISYHPMDIHSVLSLTDGLREAGLSVWYADPNETDTEYVLTEKGKAVTGCKVFVLMLSKNSAQDQQCKDELALAYITNSSIFPVGLERIRTLTPMLDCGIKLMLAKINWTFFVKPEDFENNLPGLLSFLKQEIASRNIETPISYSEDSPFHFLYSFSHVDSATGEAEPGFWQRNFQDKGEVTWVDFKNQFLKDYGEQIREDYPDETLNVKYFVNLMYKDIFVLEKVIKWSVYDKFCEHSQQADPDWFYTRLQEYARGLYAMKEVFDMNSTLRITAVKNLGKFSTPAVVSHLLEMLVDADPNIRAVAAVALARSGSSSKKVIDRLLKSLEDEDRLVRESACFALGFLQAVTAVDAIADRWRNDPISHVRAAASEALKMMNCTEAKECVHMTEVLTAEMAALRTEDKA